MSVTCFVRRGGAVLKKMVTPAFGTGWSPYPDFMRGPLAEISNSFSAACTSGASISFPMSAIQSSPVMRMAK